jgi:hypothetical protein
MPQLQPFEAVEMVMADEADATDWTPLGNPAECGIAVPAGLTSADISVEVAVELDENGDAVEVFPVVDKEGTQILKVTGSTGGFAFSSNECGALLGYPYVRVFSSVAQNSGPFTFYLLKKLVRVSRLE